MTHGLPSFDPATLTILERVNHVATLLEHHNQSQSQFQSQLAMLTNLQFYPIKSPGISEATNAQAQRLMQPIPQSLQLTEQGAFSESTLDGAATLIESLEIPAKYHGSCEDVLNWPIFEGKYRRENIELLIFNPGLAERFSDEGIDDDALPVSPLDPRRVKGSVRTQGPGRGVREDDAPKLIQIFLENVHPKNPIVDPKELKRMGKVVAEHGFGWDSQSCLVVGLRHNDDHRVGLTPF